MAGYSEVIQTMAAMIIFSIILLSANSMIHRNTMFQVSGELEQEVISVGQEIIEEARAKSFDQVTVNSTAPPALIPGGFTASENLGPDGLETLRRHFDDFDDYNGWAETITTTHGDFNIEVEVYYVERTPAGEFNRVNTQTTFKKIDVFVTSEFLRSGNEPQRYVLEFIRNYYAD
ncbi:MAG: hypothetical protein ACNA78_06770 [Balneolaceae bacterium]